MTLQIGAALQNGHYVLESVTHQDDSGATYRGTHILSGRLVSIKFWGNSRSQYLESFLLRAEFMDQIQRLAQLRHPSIVEGLHAFEEDGRLFLVMAADIGLSLAQIVRASGPLSETAALSFLHQIADALSLARQVGLKHLDLDPRLIFRKFGTHCIVLTGFEFSRVSLNERQSLQGELSPSSRGAYLENLPLVPKSRQSDIYQLAALLYYLLTGELITPGMQRGLDLSSSHWRVDIGKATQQAIQLGLGLPKEVPISALKEWLTFLPDVGCLSDRGGGGPQALIEPPIFSPERSVAIASPSLVRVQPTPGSSIQSVVSNQQPVPIPTTAPSLSNGQGKHLSPVKPGSKIRNLALIMTVFVSALTGLGFGTALRFGTSNQPRRIRFDPDQSFPPLEDWVEDPPTVDFESPYLPSEKSISGQSRPSPITLETPRPAPSSDSQTNDTNRKAREFNWLEQEAVIPDYPNLKRPRSSLGAWPTDPETVNPSRHAPNFPKPGFPDSEPFPSVAPTLPPQLEPSPSTAISEDLDDAVESSPAPDQLVLPMPAPAPVVTPANGLERGKEPKESAMHSLE